MKKSRFSEKKIISVLRENEEGVKPSDLCRRLGISEATFYNWKKKYGGMDARQLTKLKELEEENRRLKQMYADLSLDHRILKEIVEKKL